MITKTTRINEFMFRWSDDGQPRGAHVVDREEIRDGEIVVASRFLDPRPVGVADAPTLAEISAVINAAALAECAALASQVAALTTERDTAVADLVTRTAERDALQAQIDAAAVADRVESHKARIELIVRGEWPAVLALVEALPEPQRSIVTEALYAPYYNRSSPTLAALAQARGWSDAYVDELWAAAVARVV